MTGPRASTPEPYFTVVGAKTAEVVNIHLPEPEEDDAEAGS